MTEAEVALIGSLLTFAGVVITVIAGNRKTDKSIKENGNLTLYRINELEKKVEKHNSVVERTFILEGQMLEAQHDIRDIKTKI